MLFERKANRYFNRLYESLLDESRKHYSHIAVQTLQNSGLFKGQNEDFIDQFVHSLYKGGIAENGNEYSPGIPAFTHAPKWMEEYVPNIANWIVEYCGTNESKLKSFFNPYDADSPVNLIDYYLKNYIIPTRDKLPEKQRHGLVDEYNKLSLKDLENKVKEFKNHLNSESDNRLSQMEFNKSDYKLIPIESYEQFHQMFGGRWTGDNGEGAWCTVGDENTYESYRGHGVFFVLAKNNWKNIKFDPETNKQYAGKDEYGLSLIVIVVGGLAQIKYVTLRCNHNGVRGNADNQFNNYADLSEIAGFNVKTAVYNYMKENNLLMEPFEFVYDGSETAFNYCKRNKKDEDCIVSAKILNATKIKDYAFAFCHTLSSIEIPESATTIGMGAFFDCTSLESVKILGNITEIEVQTFFNCNSLKSIKIPESVTTIGVEAFHNCSSLESIKIPDSTMEIGEEAFRSCSSLESLEIPDGVTRIEKYAFVGCTCPIYIPAEDVNDYAAWRECVCDRASWKGFKGTICSSITGAVLKDFRGNN